MDENILEGGLKQGIGRAEQAVGDAYGDLGMRLHGKVQELSGKVQTAYGQAKDTAAGTIGAVASTTVSVPSAHATVMSSASCPVPSTCAVTYCAACPGSRTDSETVAADADPATAAHARPTTDVVVARDRTRWFTMPIKRILGANVASSP